MKKDLARHVDTQDTHAHAPNEGGRGKKVKKGRREGKRAEARIQDPHKPVNKICGADKL